MELNNNTTNEQLIMGVSVMHTGKENPTWIFINKDTGTLIEHQYLPQLLFELTHVHGLALPKHVDVDLLLRSRVDIAVKDELGNVINIVIGEHHPAQGIYFDKPDKMN